MFCWEFVFFKRLLIFLDIAVTVPYFALLIRDPDRLRLVNVGPDLVRCFVERLEQLVELQRPQCGYVILKDLANSGTSSNSGVTNGNDINNGSGGNCYFNVYDVVFRKPYFSSTENLAKEDVVLIKVAVCRLLGAFFCRGYDVLVSSDLSRDLRTHSFIFFKLRDSPHDLLAHNHSHKFICVAPFANDSILLINVPKVAVEPIIKASAEGVLHFQICIETTSIMTSIWLCCFGRG